MALSRFSRYDIFLAKSLNSNCELKRNNLVNLNYFKNLINCEFNTSLEINDKNQFYK